jgi:hypothetical protein
MIHRIEGNTLVITNFLREQNIDRIIQVSEMAKKRKERWKQKKLLEYNNNIKDKEEEEDKEGTQTERVPNDDSIPINTLTGNNENPTKTKDIPEERNKARPACAADVTAYAESIKYKIDGEYFIDYYLFLPSLDNKKDVTWQCSRLYLDWLKLNGVLPAKLENFVENWYTADEVEQHIIILEPEILYTRPTSDWHTWFDPTGKYGSEQIKNPFYQECNFELDGKKYYRIEEHNV